MKIDALRGLLLIGVAWVGQASAHDDSSTVIREARRLAACMKSMDANCVIALSDKAAYERLSPPGFQFEASQRRFFEGFKGAGLRYTRFEITGDPLTFEQQGSLYSFVPYTMESVSKGRPSKVAAYFVGRSADGGVSWKFVDGAQLRSEQVRVLIPAYRGEPALPFVRLTGSNNQPVASSSPPH